MNLPGRDHLEDQSIDGWIILRQILYKYGVDSIHFIQGMEQWRARMDIIASLPFSQKAGTS
jgi:aryl carrier-like protein